MSRSPACGSAFVLTAVVRLTAAVPALADMPNPDVTAAYRQETDRLVWAVVGCAGVLFVIALVGAVFVIRWAIRKNAATAPETAPSTPTEKP